MTIIARRVRSPLLTLLCLLLISGCVVNPVTGEKQLSLISESQERAMGAEQYVPTQQTQGGKYYADPELTRYVRSVGQKLAAVSDRPDLPYEFVILNNGVPNAWALPSGKIAVNRGLLTELDNEAQLAAVLGHEITHAAARHSVQQMQQGMIINAGMAGLGMALTDNDYARMIMGGAALGSQIVMARHSQSDELEADHYGIQYMVKAGYDPEAAVELQRTFVKLSEGQHSGFIEGLFASHPPSPQRVEANQAMVQKLGNPGGELGRATYQNKLAYLKKHMPAYTAEQEAIKSYKAGNKQAALDKINEAIRIEPKEASFYALRGRIYEDLKGPDSSQARSDYDKAVSLYPEMFTYRLQRGLNAFQLNNLKQARQDLTAANESVPTSIAYLRLGDIAVRQNQRQEAVADYSQAASADGAIAAEAQRKLAALKSSQ